MQTAECPFENYAYSASNRHRVPLLPARAHHCRFPPPPGRQHDTTACKSCTSLPLSPPVDRTPVAPTVPAVLPVMFPVPCRHRGRGLQLWASTFPLCGHRRPASVYPARLLCFGQSRSCTNRSASHTCIFSVEAPSSRMMPTSFGVTGSLHLSLDDPFPFLARRCVVGFGPRCYRRKQNTYIIHHTCNNTNSNSRREIRPPLHTLKS